MGFCCSQVNPLSFEIWVWFKWRFSVASKTYNNFFSHFILITLISHHLVWLGNLAAIEFVSTIKLSSLLVSTDGSRSNPEHGKNLSLSCMDKLNKANLLLKESTQLIPETSGKYSKEVLVIWMTQVIHLIHMLKSMFSLITDFAVISLNWSKSLQKKTAVLSF